MSEVTDKLKPVESEVQKLSTTSLIVAGGLQLMLAETLKLRDAAELTVKLRAVCEDIGKIKAVFEKLHDLLRFSIIPNLMDADDTRTVTFEGIGRIIVKDDIRCTVVEGQRENLYRWLIDQGFEDLITETVNAQTLAAFVRKRMRGGEPLPEDGILSVIPFQRAEITKV